MGRIMGHYSSLRAKSTGWGNKMQVELSDEQISAIYLLIFHREQPAYGWMEAPLVEVQALLEPLHTKIHNISFNAMNRQFFGDNRFGDLK